MKKNNGVLGLIVIMLLMFSLGFGVYYVFVCQDVLNDNKQLKDELNGYLIEDKWRLESCYQQLGDLEDRYQNN